MILKPKKQSYIIFGAIFGIMMGVASATDDGFGVIGTLIYIVIAGSLLAGVFMFINKHWEKRAYYCRHKVESVQEVICQGSAAIGRWGFNSNGGWMFLGNQSLDYYKTTAASGEKLLEIKLSDIVSTSVRLNTLTITTDAQPFAFRVAQANEWKKQIDQTMQRIASTQTNAQNNTDTTQELIKFKQLLDAGVITQEEFDTKKKQLLGM